MYVLEYFLIDLSHYDVIISKPKHSFGSVGYTHQMAKEGTGRVFRSGEARTLFLSIPSRVAQDSAFPFEEDEEVTIRVEDDRVVVVRDEE